MIIDIVNRLRFDAIRCRSSYTNIEDAVTEIERLRDALHIARSALLGIGTDYSKGVADAVGEALSLTSSTTVL